MQGNLKMLSLVSNTCNCKIVILPIIVEHLSFLEKKIESIIFHQLTLRNMTGLETLFWKVQ